MKLTTEQRAAITFKLRNYIQCFPSQKQAVNSLRDISEATVINILNDKNSAVVSDAMFINIENQLDRKSTNQPVVETGTFQTLILYYTLAQDNGATFALIGGAGWGKTFTGKKWSNIKRESNVFYLECAEYWNKKMFLTSMLQSMGRPSTGMNVAELMHSVVTELRHLTKPMFIFDEIDKLSDPVLKFFITLYNELNGACGFVWQSTNNIEKRMAKGLNANRNGYQELFSRIGMRFVQLPRATDAEIKELCSANHITDNEDIYKIIHECNGDLRRVDRNLLKKEAQRIAGSIKGKIRSAA